METLSCLGQKPQATTEPQVKMNTRNAPLIGMLRREMPSDWPPRRSRLKQQGEMIK